MEVLQGRKFRKRAAKEIKPQTGNYTFKLMYGRDTVGYLNFKNLKWKFEYSEWFKNQTELAPLIQFPNKLNIYESERLWPFFKARIPSEINRNQKHKGEQSPQELLRIYGKRSINNPFILKNI